MSKKPQLPIADYITQQIALSGVAQKEIARELGYDKPNIITMFKQGSTKVPLNKIAPLARILGIDAIHLLRMAMLEYQPETWNVLEQIMGRQVVTDSEAFIVDLVRQAAGDRAVVPKNIEQEEQLKQLVSGWAADDTAHAIAAVKATERRKRQKEKQEEDQEQEQEEGQKTE